MLSPPAMCIEQAADELKTVPEFIANSQLKELQAFGPARAVAIGASGFTDDFKRGYELGLATARVVLAGSVTLALANVDPTAIL